MADVSDNGSFNANLLSQINGQFGPTATAAQAKTRADTGLTQQQTAEAAMKNKILQARLPVIMQALQDYGQGADTSGVTPGGIPEKRATAPQPDDSGVEKPEKDPASSWYDPAQIDAGLRQRYFVNPAGTPQEVQAIVQAGVSGDQGLLESAKARREFGVQQRQAQAQYDSGNTYDAMSSVVDAPAGSALDALAALAPQTAAKIKQTIPESVDEDAAARAYAAHVAGSVHMYTGRKTVTRPDGTYVDEATGKPVPGIEKSGLSEQQWTDLAKSGSELVTVKQNDGSETQIPRWQAPGQNASSLQDWVMRTAQKGGALGAMPTVGGAPKAAAQAAVAKATAGAPNASGTPPVQTKPPANTPAPMQLALADRSWRDPAAPGGAPVKAGQSQSTVGKGLSDTYVAQRKEAQETFSENATAASQALQNFKAAKAILGAPDGSHVNAIAGLPGTVVQELARLGYDTSTADKRAEAVKYLTNGALQNLKPIYGGKPGVFDVKVNLEQAFPSVKDMPLNATRNLIDSQIRQMEYIRDSATRGSQYLLAGNRPYDFNSWNEKFFPRSDAVNPKEPAGKQMPSGGKLKGYADKYFGGDVEKAKAFLASEGHK